MDRKGVQRRMSALALELAFWAKPSRALSPLAPLNSAPPMGDDDHGRPFFLIDGEFDPNEGAIPTLTRLGATNPSAFRPPCNGH